MRGYLQIVFVVFGLWWFLVTDANPSSDKGASSFAYAVHTICETSAENLLALCDTEYTRVSGTEGTGILVVVYVFLTVNVEVKFRVNKDSREDIQYACVDEAPSDDVCVPCA